VWRRLGADGNRVRQWQRRTFTTINSVWKKEVLKSDGISSNGKKCPWLGVFWRWKMEYFKTQCTDSYSDMCLFQYEHHSRETISLIALFPLKTTNSLCNLHHLWLFTDLISAKSYSTISCLAPIPPTVSLDIYASSYFNYYKSFQIGISTYTLSLLP
jgi:hypothetical protein